MNVKRIVKLGKLAMDFLKLLICLVLFVFSFVVYYSIGIPSLVNILPAKTVAILRYLILAIVGSYIGALLTLTLKNDIKRLQAAVLLVLSLIMVNLYFSALGRLISKYGSSVSMSSYTDVLVLSIVAGFIITYKVHPKEGVCKFAGIRYLKQQKVIKFAALVPAVYISIITLIELLWRFEMFGVAGLTKSNFVVVLFIAWLAGVLGLYYFIKVDVGSKYLTILGHTGTGKTVLMTCMLGFMTDSKFTKEFKGATVISHKDINSLLGVDESEDVANILWDNYYNNLKFGRSWGLGTRAGSLASLGAKVKIMPYLYSCITFRLFDHPGIRFGDIIRVLNEPKIKNSIPDQLDRRSIEVFSEVIRNVMGFTDERVAKELAIILTLIKEGEKIFYLLDGHKFVYDLITSGKLNIKNDSIKEAIIRSARSEGSIQMEFMDYMQLRQAVSSNFDKEVYLVFTKADILCLVADYCDDPDIVEFKDNFEAGNYEVAKNILLCKILTKYGVVGYGQIEDIEEYFIVVGVISKLEEDELVPRGGSCDDFIRISGLMETVRD